MKSKHFVMSRRQKSPLQELVKEESIMEITLEKIELVKDRTGVSYKEAKEALEASDGSVVDAIIYIEDTIDDVPKKSVTDQKTEIVEKLKALVKKGNVSKIVISKDGESILRVPVNVGIIGGILAPFAMIAGVAASFGFKCKIEVIKEDGTAIDISEKATEKFDEAKEKGADIYETVKDKANQAKDGKVVETVTETMETVKEKAEDAMDKAKEFADDAVDKAREKAEDAVDKAKEKMKDVKEDKDIDIDLSNAETNDTIDDIFEEVKEDIDED